MTDSGSLRASSIEIAEHQSDIISEMKSIISTVFGDDDAVHIATDLNEYRSIMLTAQQMFNAQNLNKTIFDNIPQDLTRYLETDAILIQSNIYLRASRPYRPSAEENISWHRESFYGPNLSKAVNIWTPIRGVCAKNTLQYIPESQLIPDADIVTQNEGVTHTPRFSIGHKLGFNYDPKKITGGVDLDDSTRLVVPCGRSAIFSSNLIHGAAVNESESIRFSVDFQVIRKSDYSSLNKKFHFSSGKEYFVEI